MSVKHKLITHTGGGKKFIINMDVAAKELNKGQLNQLNNVLVELNDVQERIDRNDNDHTKGN